jgi:hypothetical protein
MKTFLSLPCVLALSVVFAPALNAAPLITSVVETGGDNEPTDTITARWTGQVFPVSIANEPVPGAVVGNSYTVGAFGNHAPAFVDRNHRYADAPPATGPTLPIPAYLLGQEYIMSGNDNRDNAGYTLDVTVSAPVRVYMLIDNRLGDPNSSNADPPSFGPTKMQWILDEGWAPVRNGLNRTANATVPDEVGIDEGADGGINQWYSVYSKDFSAGTFRLKQADNAGQNMYGVVVTPLVLSLPSVGGPVRIHVPTDDSLGSSWREVAFNDSGWQRGTNGVGYETGPGGYTGRILADSQGDWSGAGIQGENRWINGYYNKSQDANGTYQANDFQPFPRSDGPWSPINFWDGGSWNWNPDNVPWDTIGRVDVHPNGINNGEEHWVIRRWISTYSGPARFCTPARKSSRAPSPAMTARASRSLSPAPSARATSSISPRRRSGRVTTRATAPTAA